MEKQRVNTAVTKLSNLIVKARVHVVHHISAKIKLLRKRDERKNSARIERLLLEIAYLKKINDSRSRKMIARKILRNQDDHDALIQSERSPATSRAFHRLCKISCISSFVDEFRETNIDWKYWVPPLLDMWDKKNEIKKERSSSNKRKAEESDEQQNEDDSDEEPRSKKFKISEDPNEGSEKLHKKPKTESGRKSIKEFVKSQEGVNRNLDGKSKKNNDRKEDPVDTKNRSYQETAMSGKRKLSDVLSSEEELSDELDEEEVPDESDPEEEAAQGESDEDSGDEDDSEAEPVSESEDEREAENDDSEEESGDERIPFRPYSLEELAKRAHNVGAVEETSDEEDEDGSDQDEEDEVSDEDSSEDVEVGLNVDGHSSESGADESAGDEEDDFEDCSDEESEDEEELQRKRNILLAGSKNAKKKPLEIDFSVQHSLHKVREDFEDAAIREASRKKIAAKEVKQKNEEKNIGSEESDEGASFFLRDGKSPRDVKSKTIPKQNAPGMNRRERRGHSRHSQISEDLGDDDFIDSRTGGQERRHFNKNASFNGSSQRNFTPNRKFAGSNGGNFRGNGLPYPRSEGFDRTKKNSRQYNRTANFLASGNNEPSTDGFVNRKFPKQNEGNRSFGGFRNDDSKKPFNNADRRTSGNGRQFPRFGQTERNNSREDNFGRKNQEMRNQRSMKSFSKTSNNSFQEPKDVTANAESLHPSWQAKRQQSAALTKPFVGKRTVFGE